MSNGRNSRPTINGNGVEAHAGEEASPMNPFRDQTAVLVDLAAEYSRAQKAAAVNCEDPPDSLGMSPA